MPVAGGGMFGVTPQEVYQQQQQGINQSAMDIAKMDGFTAAKYAMGQVGGGLAAPVAGMLGMKNPQMEEAQQSQDIQSQIDHSTPDGLMKGAQLFNEAGNPRMAMMYQQAAQAMIAQNAELEKQQAQTAAFNATANAPVPPGRPVLSTDDSGNTTAVWPDGTTKELGQIGKTKSQGSAASMGRPVLSTDDNGNTTAIWPDGATKDLGQIGKTKTNGLAGGKPELSDKSLALQGESLTALGVTTGLQKQLNDFSLKIDNGTLNLGPLANAKNNLRNNTAMSTEESKNFALLNSTLEGMRNDSLILNKGTQTDNDAKRAWAALIDNLNDPAVVKEQLARIMDANAKAEREHRGKIKVIRDNAHLEPLDTSAFDRSVPTDQSEFPGAPTIGTVEDGHRYIGGDPSKPASWEKQ